MKKKPSYPPRMAGWKYQYERAEKLQHDLNLLSRQAASMSNDLADYASKMNSLAHYIIDQPTSNTQDARDYANDVLDFIGPRLESES